MKKIAIISELSNKTMNYGNRLQTYALNKYLSSNDFADEVHSLILNFENRKYILVEKLIYELKMLIKRILGFLRIIKSKKVSLSRENETSMFEKRLSNSQRFTRRITTKEIDSLEQMQNENYDTVVVGSDIVWKQERVAVDRMRFLDFELKNPFKKISYAASFGGVLIPKNSKKYIKKYLDDLPNRFDGCMKILTPNMIDGPAGVSALRAFIEKNLETLNSTFGTSLTTVDEVITFATQSEGYEWLQYESKYYQTYITVWGIETTYDILLPSYLYQKLYSDKRPLGYWTFSSHPIGTSSAWNVYYDGLIGHDFANKEQYRGVRPVITISKSLPLQIVEE